MDVEGIAALQTGRPSGLGQSLARDKPAQATDERADQSSLDRRQRHPTPADTQNAVVVEGEYRRAVLGRSLEQATDPSLEIRIVGGNANPVLCTTFGQRWVDTVLDEEQPRRPGSSQLVTSRGLGRPPHECNVHVSERTGARLPGCFVAMNVPDLYGAPHVA